MTTELTPKQQFDKQLEDRIRTSIGDLMPDEVLRELIEKTVENAFFKEKVIRGDYGKVTTKPPLMERVIKELLQERIDVMFREYLQNNENVIAETVENIFKDNASNLVWSAINSWIGTHMANLQANVQNDIFNAVNNQPRTY